MWLDPSDLSTMFSDRAGTIPVTTPGTFVGKRLDKSGRNNHAVAPTDGARPVYGVEPKGGRRNLLTWSEGFDNAAWEKGSGSITATNIADPIGGNTADAFTSSGSSAILSNFTNITVQSGGIYTASVWLKLPSGTDTIFLAITNQSFNILQSVNCSVTSSWQRFTVSGSVGANTAAKLLIGGSSTIGLGEVVHIWGAQLELGSTASPYQRVTTAYDVTESGVLTCHYVQYDGTVGNSLSTAAIDFTATDKVSMFAGASRIGTTAGVLAEWGAGVPSGLPGFFFYRPSATEIMFRSSGTIEVTVTSTPATQNSILTGLGDIGGDRATLRINGAQVGQNTNNQGTGTYGSYSLFFGRRNNSNLPFNGKDYGIVIVGKAATTEEITAIESWLGDKTAEVDIPKSISPNIYTRSGDTILDRSNSIIERRAL